MKITTGLVRLSYPHIFEPSETLNGDMKYSASLIIPKNSKTAERLKTAVADILATDEAKKIIGKSKIKYELLRDGDEKEDDPAYENAYFVNAKANESHPPIVVDKDRQEIVDARDVYAGCYVQAVISIYPYNKNGNCGIGAGLLAIRKIKDGEPLTGNVVSDSDFDDSVIENDGLEDLM